jgi:hypothetical protein
MFNAKTPLKWVIQNNVGKTEDLTKLVDFLDLLGVHWEHIPYIPFDLSPVHGVDTTGITLFYGSVGLVQRVKNDNRWNPGVFFSPEKLDFFAQANGFGNYLLNYDSKLYTLRDVYEGKLVMGDKELMFVRPASDTKLFTGDLFTGVELRDEVKRVIEVGNDPRVHQDLYIQIAPPKKISRELRSFVVGGKVSTSAYYGHGKRYDDPEPEDVAFAEDMAKVYKPLDVYTLDTCLLENGERKVVELNCFNSSGFYLSDIYKLVQDVNNLLREKYS